MSLEGCRETTNDSLWLEGREGRPTQCGRGDLTTLLPLSPAQRMPPRTQLCQPLYPNWRKLVSKRHMTEGGQRTVSWRPFFQQSSYKLDGRLC